MFFLYLTIKRKLWYGSQLDRIDSSRKLHVQILRVIYCGRGTGCPKINFTFLNVNNVTTNTRIATPAIYIDRGDL